MDQQTTLDNLAMAIIGGNETEIKEKTQRAVDDGLVPLDIVDLGLSKGMEVVGNRFETGEAYLPELLMASNAFNAAMEELSAATLLLEKNYPTQAFRLAVESMIMSAVALLYKKGYRNRRRAIKALVLFTEAYLGQENRSLVNKFDYY